MSDEIASATLQTSQKAIEVALELIKMLAPLAQKLLSEVYHKSVDGINDVGGKIANARSLGTVSAKNLVVEAQKANSPISTTSNFLARDAEQIAAKAKQYKIGICEGSTMKNAIKIIGTKLNRHIARCITSFLQVVSAIVSRERTSFFIE